MTAATIRLGTRGSPLALAQARLTRDALCAAHGWVEGRIEIVPIMTAGDRIQDRPLAEIGGKALWTKALDGALFAGDIDFAVHSLKDVETLRPAGITIAAMLPRADVRDRLIGATSIAALKPGARVGTSSPRRAAQLLRLRPDLIIAPIRGNVATRLAKLDAGEADATLLAAAGLDRLNQHDVGAAIKVEELLPAASQGAIGIECRTENETMRALLDAIDCKATRAAVCAERSLLAELDADCHSPVGAYAVMRDGAMILTAELLSGDGALHVKGAIVIDGPDSAAQLAKQLLEAAPPELRVLFGK
ncbi:hydroxymethylbilane synthase [Sphingomonas paeninsulae]|jgi:hydroxymethylbilane synthase|uniref:Porphobilinogen deaminase n=1 Tax=Sphingomonas paeninsulae TaxID=2319844 RepID=A0A494TLA3_SPHPE|nr:hydroxymethylbilane synthase [Sphingomonas paeninsulae]AYJ86591.1 hydroxymethylbilane synthase [Sphingomonas paeninsulae]